ncbi:unnamed protein product [Protopolystoma xenopodis]|uniref:Uncharacterized protein n=1 Tax=Protopolystoma xenopodis TaxID=117903 RepID=A0A3S5AHP4_9PLAT|nr:unnamed protein product [Protopolystoma xenopodis]
MEFTKADQADSFCLEVVSKATLPSSTRLLNTLTLASDVLSAPAYSWLDKYR